MRATKWRSNLDREGPHPGLLRSAHNDRRPARNDEESCHCEPRSGEAIQPEEALTLDCFARLAMTGGSLTMTRRVVIASHEVAKQSRQWRCGLTRVERGIIRVNPRQSADKILKSLFKNPAGRKPPL
ncbi:MAG: hypothetical protein LBT00_02915 [Spirochaetaceae bacterium]|nr:hypothetical protein [Spirochaetaceae bacterium]